ncbi:MAG: hypothetical protein IKW89_01450 [Bacteroidales bacterium]|nr:hypothetical protein [Bacteroidales bacterium]
MENGNPIGALDIPETEGITHKEKIKALDSVTFKATVTFKALEDLDSVRLEAGFIHNSGSGFWMIPSVNYNGNDWGRGKEPKGAKHDGQWRTVSFRRTPIPGAMYSEGSRYAIATWAEAPKSLKENFSCSLRPEENKTGHHYLWPEEEMPVTYANRDHFEPGWRDSIPMRKGETVVFQIYIHLSPVLQEHRGMRSFLDKAWELAPKPTVEIFPPEKLWELGIRYAKESLWAEEGPYKGFSIGLILDDNGGWRQRPAWKYEIGWCGQNASYAISLLRDYQKTGSKESLDKGIATLDTWTSCLLPNGLFVTNYDYLLSGNQNGSIDACNLGTAAVNYFEAYDMAKECGVERPEYERIGFAICDFVAADQQENGCYAKGWRPNGEIIYREGTIGCFLVPAMIEAYRRSGDKKYLDSGLRAYNHYLAELKENGFTTAGALDTWCIDKESSISLLRSAIRLHRLTGSPEYLEDAVAISYYLSTWLWHYDGVYPEDDDFSEYGYHTFGATSVSVQHNHLDPYALYWIPEWMELAELTGDSQWKEKALAIWKCGNQLVSDGTLTVNGHVRPAGSQNEAYFECSWGFSSGDNGHRINNWLVAWPGAFRLETIRRLEGKNALD